MSPTASSVRSLAFLLALCLSLVLAGCGGDGGDDGGQDTSGGVDTVTPGDASGSDVAAPDAGGTDAVDDTAAPPDAAADGDDHDAGPSDAGPTDVPPDPPDAAADGDDDADPGDPCTPNPCDEPDRGVCAPADAAPGYTCDCDPGYVEDADGACVPAVEPCDGDAACDDGLFCNGAERCAPGADDAGADGCAPGEPPTIDDGDACTADTCDEEADEVVHEPHVCPSNAHCVPAPNGEPDCACDPGYEMNEVGLCRACEIDPQEDNDTPGAAKPAAQARGQRLSVDPNDPDWFTVDVCEGGTITVELYFDETLGDIDGFLYALDGETVLASGETTTADERFEWVSDREGQILLQVVMPEGGCNRYMMTYEVVGCEDCPDDALEPSDDRATAPSLAGAVGEPLVMAGTDEDWYAVEACVGQQIVVTALHDTSLGDVSMRIYPAEIDSSMAPATVVAEGTQIDWVVTADGWYYIVLHAESNLDCIPYELAYEWTECANFDCEDDSLEDNDSADTAVAFTSAYSEVEGGLEGVRMGVTTDDADWFSASLCAGENLMITPAPLSDPYTDGRVEVAIVALDGETVLASARSQDEGTFVNYTAPADETVYVRVTTTRDVCDPYRLEIVRTGCQACTDDDGEDDDSAAAARPLALDSEVEAALCGDDEDWYVVELCEGSLPDILTFLSADAGTLEMALVDGDGETVIVAGETADGFVQLRHDALPAGTYYIRVRLVADTDAPGVGYTIRAVEICCPPDGAEPNDTPAQGLDMSQIPDVSNLNVTADAVDWYEYLLCPGHPLDMTVTYQAGGATLEATLFAADGETVLVEPISTADGPRFIYSTAEAEEIVYLRVVGQPSPDGNVMCLPYAFTYEGDAPPDCLGLIEEGP